MKQKLSKQIRNKGTKNNVGFFFYLDFNYEFIQVSTFTTTEFCACVFSVPLKCGSIQVT